MNTSSMRNIPLKLEVGKVIFFSNFTSFIKNLVAEDFTINVSFISISFLFIINFSNYIVLYRNKISRIKLMLWINKYNKGDRRSLKIQITLAY
ncbi:MAG: hypothetical protein CBR30_06960 [Dictyoglomus sp. NZ13-RE01]|nr:MAG: hypothetical protein CBR30_06960 [Dictyoglomus sp. NZ13-RE01]